MSDEFKIDLNPIEHLWRGLENACPLIVAIQLAKACEDLQRRMAKIPKSRCTMLVTSDPVILEIVITTKGVSNKH